MWAYILSLKIKAYQNPRNSHFYHEALKLINLTLQGKTSAREMEAWLLNNIFARVDSAKARVAEVNANSELHNNLQAHTMRMDEAVFNDLEAMHAVEISLPHGHHRSSLK